jgi:hypothetical protein
MYGERQKVSEIKIVSMQPIWHGYWPGAAQAFVAHLLRAEIGGRTFGEGGADVETRRIFVMDDRLS